MGIVIIMIRILYLLFPNQDVDNEWQHKQNWGRWREPQEEFSFLLNSSVELGIRLSGDKVQ